MNELDIEVFKEEKAKILKRIDEALTRVMLSEDRTSKHPPYTWLLEDEDQHLLKAERHINTYIQIRRGYQKQDGENHLDNAITRLAMAVARKEGI